ncbi:hypothetical protein VIGAN_08102800, partial [Vigna angularis var. angularis]
FQRTFKYQSTSHVTSIHVSSVQTAFTPIVRPLDCRAFVSSLIINIRSLALDLTCYSTARQSACVRAFKQ